jgi:hypothetical protein
MTLDDYVKRQQTAVLEFQAYWMFCRQGNEDHFPIDLREGEWDEQLDAFIAHTRKSMGDA